MVAKFERQAEYGVNSRASLFSNRLLDFEDSPILGVGFAVGYRGGVKQIGRMESGSGWFSIVCQTGLVGLFIVLYILYKALKRNIKRVKHDDYLKLIVPVFVFLCAHSFFEGYILTSGYYLCILFWGILGILAVYPKYAKVGNNRIM